VTLAARCWAPTSEIIQAFSYICLVVLLVSGASEELKIADITVAGRNNEEGFDNQADNKNL